MKGVVFMNIIMAGKHVELTDGIKSAIEKKMSKLNKFISDESDVKVTISARKGRHTIEVTAIATDGTIVRAEDTEDDLYVAIDKVIDKLIKQIRRFKSKMKKKHHDPKSIRYEFTEEPGVDNKEDEDDDEYVIERRKRFNVKPMSEEEAILQMDMLGHDFYLFKNVETDEIALVYKRKNGGYGIIEQY